METPGQDASEVATTEDLGSTLHERRKGVSTMSNSQFRLYVEACLHEGREQFSALREDNQQLSRQLQSMTDSHAVLVDVIETGKTTLKVISMIGRGLNKVAKWIAPIIAAVGMVIAIMHGSFPSKE